MKNEQEAMESGALVGAAFTALYETVAELIVDPREIVRIAAERLTKLSYPTAQKERQAAGVIRSSEPRITELVMDGDIPGLRRLLGDIAERCRQLTMPDPVPSFQDDFRECIHLFLNSSWSINEAEAVRYFSRHGDRIGKITPSTVQLGDRVITRAECREALAKGGYSPARLAQLAEIERRRIAVDAENVERAKRGEGPIVYAGGSSGMTRY